MMGLGVALDEDDPDTLMPRPPVVTIMGHVDHGKTSLLDAIRNTRVTAGEAGGITQHIAAYQAEHEGSTITFIDTPGHAAFTDMRERGANTADMIILVVAADDSVKQQTADSIACARQAEVPLIVAVNKIDLEAADPNRVLADLAGYEILTEDLGGEVLCSQISAKEGTGLDDLLSKVMLQAEVLDLKANPDRDAHGVVLEARVEKGLGTVATTLIQRGTVRVGDSFVAGEAAGKVRALIGFDGKTRYKEAGPSTPVSIVGMNGVPAAGDLFVVAEDEQTARELAESRTRCVSYMCYEDLRSYAPINVRKSGCLQNRSREEGDIVPVWPHAVSPGHLRGRTEGTPRDLRRSQGRRAGLGRGPCAVAEGPQARERGSRGCDQGSDQRERRRHEERHCRGQRHARHDRHCIQHGRERGGDGGCEGTRCPDRVLQRCVSATCDTFCLVELTAYDVSQV